jgi:hypothetical protein
VSRRQGFGYSRGWKLDGAHSAVQKHPQYWLPADTSDDELLIARNAIWADAGAWAVTV